MLLEWTQNNAAQLRRYYGKTTVWTWVSGAGTPVATAITGKLIRPDQVYLASVTT